MVGDKKNIACKALGNLRVLVAQREGLTNKDEYKKHIVVDLIYNRQPKELSE